MAAKLFGTLTALAARLHSFNPDRSRVAHAGTVHELRSHDYDGARAAVTGRELAD